MSIDIHIDPLARTCPKCRSGMHRSYHPAGTSVPYGTCDLGGHGSPFCRGGSDEHLQWACTCGFTEVTPCADADRTTP